MKRIIALLLCLMMAISAVACSGGNTPAETTKAPETQAPATEAPETEAPATEAPATEAPVETTEVVEATTEAPVETTAEPAETEAPETEAPATEAPEVTEAPAVEKSGCGSMIAGAVAVVALLGTAIVFKKKD